MSVVARHYFKRVVEKYAVVKDFTPIFSYFHIQKESIDHSDMCEKIKYGISRNPGTLHILTWNTQYQINSSVTDIIHFADKYNTKLILDVNPHDHFACFLWKGIRHMYPNTFIFPTYFANSRHDLKKLKCDSKNKSELLENMSIIMSNEELHQTNEMTKYSKNIIVTSKDIYESTDPTYASLTHSNTDTKKKDIPPSPRTLLYVPVLL
jgi:hypothetical protein